MSFLQTVGIASQASDKYDEERQARRMTSQREATQQQQLDQYDLYRGVVQHAIQYQAEQEAAIAAATKAAAAATRNASPAGIVAPSAPTAPGGEQPQRNPYTGEAVAPMPTSQSVRNPYTMADGGPVKAEPRFNGIYDDDKVGSRLPSHYNRMAQRWSEPGYKDGGSFHHALAEIVHHTRRLADGGSIDSNGVAMLKVFKDGGPIMSFAHGAFTKGAKAKSKSKPGGKRAVDLDGAVRGPGTGTSDSVPAVGPGGSPYRLSDGEYVLSADTVRAVGKDKLDALQARHHKKV